MTRLLRRVAPVLAVVLAAWGVAQARNPAPTFDHARHVRLFPASCAACHLGAQQDGAPIYPAATACAACHDGSTKPPVQWQPPGGGKPTNLRFTHAAHRRETNDSVRCASCHAGTGAAGSIHRDDPEQCVSCHEPGKSHLTASDRQCARCHVPLARATALPIERVAAFPSPPNHQAADFASGGHGKLAARGNGVAASCATCHARTFCAACHVNAPETAAIQALQPDERSLAIKAELKAPATHASPTFLDAHGREAAGDPARCATCHAQPSCTACHVAPGPKAVRAMAMPGEGRGTGAVVARHAPASHTAAFTEGHGPEASASPRACETCHRRDQCLTCHRGSPTTGPNYHPANFLTRHPAATYARQTSCADCHNVQQFCVTCHASAGLGAHNTLRAGPYHDAKGAFVLNHGQAARQSLESCVSCHVERDCTSCHSALGGRRFSPHGPGFDAERLRRRNPEMCIACHGRAIPGGS